MIDQQQQSIGIIPKVLLAIAFVVLVVCAFIFPITEQDSIVHLSWLSQFPKLFVDGAFYPRWLPDSFAGFGAPVFYFYPPLVYWVSSLFYAVGLHSEYAMFQSTTLFFTLLSGVTCYWYLRKITENKNKAFFGALLYCVFPYRFTDMYLRDAIGEHAAFVFVPLIFGSLLMIQRYKPHQKMQLILLTSIAWAGLIITNIPTTVIMVYTSIIYVIVTKLHNTESRKAIGVYAIGIILALVTASVYILPAIDLNDAISPRYLWDITSEGVALTGNQFIDIFRDPQWKKFYASLIITAFIGLLVFLQYRKKQEVDAVIKPILSQWNILIAVALLFQIPYLLFPVWEYFPMLKLLQFPWRWNVIVTFVVTLYAVQETGNKLQGNIIIAFCAVTTIVIALSFYNSRFSYSVFDVKKGSLSRSLEYVPNTITMSREDLATQFSKHQRDPEIQIVSGYAAFRSIKREPSSTSFEVVSNAANATVIFKRLYFPTWQLKDDRGVHYAIRPDSIGRIVATIPEGKRAYQLSIIPSNEELVGSWLTVVGLSSMIALAILIVLSRRKVEPAL